jgi:hypothetical protein
MGHNTRIYHRFQGYTTADCRCCYCAYWRGKKRGCAPEACCCADERAEAFRRVQLSSRRAKPTQSPVRRRVRVGEDARRSG